MKPVTVSPRNADAFSSSAAVETGKRGLILTELSAAAGRPRCPFFRGLALVGFMSPTILTITENAMFFGAKKAPPGGFPLCLPASSQAFG